MPRGRSSSASTNSSTQTTLDETVSSPASSGPASTEVARKPKTRRSADDEIALYKAKLAAAEDRKLIEDVRAYVETKDVDKRILAAFTAMTRLRGWLSDEIYDRIRSELRAALRHGHAPVELASTDNEDDNEET